MALTGRTNSYFQNAVRDPARNMTSRAGRSYKLAGASKKAVPEVAGTYKVTIGTPDAGQRTWELPKALLARHSTFFASLFQDYPNREEPDLLTVSPTDFANFVDYMHSNIYSLNTKVAGYRSIRANTDACLLGIRLEAKKYTDAALIQLHNLFLSFAKLRFSNAKLTLIRASDIQYVCDQTSTVESFSAAALKKLFFDAIAAHWAARDILSIGAPHLETVNDNTTWTHVYGEYHDFRVWIVNSAPFPDKRRVEYLLPTSKYLEPMVEWVDPALEQEGGKGGTLSRGSFQGGIPLPGGSCILIAFIVLNKRVPDAHTGIKTKKTEDSTKTEDGETKTPRLRLRLKLPNIRRSNSDSERQPTAASTVQDLESMRQEYDEAINDMEMDIGMDAGIEDEEIH
jgi:hypothetical protein